ncbi:hypothetical protein C5B85_03325 [Pseudoclavibacter sp. AY1F1]|nr:hypothetical protein C5B85_03325 [Pseudoclavibacter sp. AY1F1]
MRRVRRTGVQRRGTVVRRPRSTRRPPRSGSAVRRRPLRHRPQDDRGPLRPCLQWCTQARGSRHPGRRAAGASLPRRRGGCSAPSTSP